MTVTGTSSIKSIQRGTGSGNGTITLDHAVNPNKSIVLLDSGAVSGYGSGIANGQYVFAAAAASNGVCVSSLSSSSFTVVGAIVSVPYTNDQYRSIGMRSANITYSWQVIEYY